MYHQHFRSIDSTQAFLKEKLEELKTLDDNILISATNQTAGVGRKGNAWETLPNALAMSFTLKPNCVPTMTPIEIGLLVTRFIKDRFQKKIQLKWPNDLLTREGKKCGGILSQYIDAQNVIAGLGLNLGKILPPPQSLAYPLGVAAILPELQLLDIDQENISKDLYSYLLKNRYINQDDLRRDFNQSCFHLNMKVLIQEDQGEFIGFFRGIGSNGEALVEINATIHHFLSSSLSIIN